MSTVEELQKLANEAYSRTMHRVCLQAADELDAKTKALTNLANAAAALSGKLGIDPCHDTELAWLRAELKNAKKVLGK